MAATVLAVVPHRNVSSHYGEVLHDSVEENSLVAHWRSVLSDAPAATSRTIDGRRVTELCMLSTIVHARCVGDVGDIRLQVA